MKRRPFLLGLLPGFLVLALTMTLTTVGRAQVSGTSAKNSDGVPGRSFKEITAKEYEEVHGSFGAKPQYRLTFREDMGNLCYWLSSSNGDLFKMNGGSSSTRGKNMSFEDARLRPDFRQTFYLKCDIIDQDGKSILATKYYASNPLTSELQKYPHVSVWFGSAYPNPRMINVTMLVPSAKTSYVFSFAPPAWNKN